MEFASIVKVLNFMQKKPDFQSEIRLFIML